VVQAALLALHLRGEIAENEIGSVRVEALLHHEIDLLYCAALLRHYRPSRTSRRTFLASRRVIRRRLNLVHPCRLFRLSDLAGQVVLRRPYHLAGREVLARLLSPVAPAGPGGP
jgi:hypothetical protein